MKKLHILVFFILGIIVVNAQTTKSAAPQVIQASSELKANFIKNQNYLSESTVKDFKNYYGDSLSGFDEPAVRAQLLSSNLNGQEMIHVLNLRRRQFINTRYSIGATASPAGRHAAPQTHSPLGRPIGGSNTVNTLPCVNEGFEATPVGAYTGAANATAIQGWTLSSYPANGVCGYVNWQPGTPEAWIINTPVTGVPGLGTLPNSPLGGTKILRLQDANIGTGAAAGLQSKVVQTFPVTSANTLFQFAYAGAWNDGGHNCCEQPALHIAMYDCLGGPLSCSSLSLNATGASCAPTIGSNATFTVSGSTSWTNWQVKYIDLTPFVGSCVTIEFINGDCIFAGHWGTLFLDTQCGGQVIGIGLGGTGTNISGPVSYCAGSNQAIITAPLGYASYQWISPATGTVPAYLGGTAPSLTITAPVPNSVYTVNLTTGSGCLFIATDTIKTSQINIVAIGANPTCPGGGAAGSATVVGNGSGQGYTYNWQNSSGTTVGTTSMITGLTAGIYSVTLGGLGVAGCGVASATTQVGVTATPTTALTKPYCGNSAFLSAPLAGSNYQWYNNTTPVLIGNGGNSSSITVNNPCNGCIYWLSYNSIQGCRDSIQFYLYPSVGGSLTVPGPGTVCPSGTNGTPTITVLPAPGSPPGVNGYTVTSLSAPTYSSAVHNVAYYTYNPTGLAAGSYSVNAFDGSCYYNTTFNVSTLNFNFSVTPTATTVCSGDHILANMNFYTPPGLNEYIYSWLPNTYLSGNTAINTIITPTTVPGVNATIVYTAMATSTLALCPVMHTLTVTVLNPAIPVFSTIPNMCDNGAAVTITATPSGGTYSTAVAPGQLIGPLSGVITPSLGVNGVNTFSYTFGVGTCSVRSTGTFQVNHFNPSVITGTVLPVCTTGLSSNLMNIVQSTASGTWTGIGVGSTGGPLANVFSPSSVTFSANAPNPANFVLTYSTSSSPNPSVCPSSNTLLVSVTHPVTPTITPVAAFCTNGVPFNLSGAPAGGTWSGSGVPGNGVITPSAMAGSNAPVVVNYNVTVGACVNTATTSLSISQYHDPGFSGPVPTLCSNNNLFNLENIANSPNGSWTPSVQISPLLPLVASPAYVTQTSYLNPAANLLPGSQTVIINHHMPSTPGNATLCASNQTILAVIIHPVLPIIVQPNPLCNNSAPIQLSVSPNTGSWVPTQYLSATGLFTPSLGIVGNNAVQYIVGSSTCSAQQSQNISVEAFVPASITASLLPDQCASNAAVNLTPFSLTGLGSWSGPGVSGIGFHPATVGQGVFVLTHHTASSPSGLCPDQATVAVHVYSLQTPVLSNIGPFCSAGAVAQIQPVPAGGIFSSLNSGAIDQHGLFNPGQAAIGNNIISYTVTSGPCTAYAQSTVSVEKFITADLSGYPNASYCKNQTTPLNLDQFVQNPGGLWYSDGGSVTGNQFIFANANVGNNNIVKYMIKSVPFGLCTDTTFLRINVADVPNITVSRIQKSQCAPVAISFVPNTNVDYGPMSWDYGDGSPVQTSSEHTFNTPGTYSVVLTVAGSCTVRAYPEPVVVHENPKASFSVPEEINTSNTEVQVNNLTGGNNLYQWQVNGAPVLTGPSPSFMVPATPGRYPVTLTVTNAYHCTDVLTKVIEVKNEFNVFIPTSFTPNSDKLNDLFIPVFTPYGLDVNTFEMEVFDRWGTSLFRTKDVSKGWDGSIQNKGSELLKEDVYVYKLRYKDMDGNVYSKMGHVTLVR